MQTNGLYTNLKSCSSDQTNQTVQFKTMILRLTSKPDVIYSHGLGEGMDKINEVNLSSLFSWMSVISPCVC